MLRPVPGSGPTACCGGRPTWLGHERFRVVHCKSPVAAFTGGTLPQGGDSGSPFYAKSGTDIHIRGIVIAGDGVTTAFAETWSRISARFGVSITT
jgi:hypothetical protein